MRHNEPIEIRNLQFAVDGHRPRFWHGGRKSVSTFFDNLSVFFPKGERFFMASVNAQRKHVTDPQLLEAIKAFCGQEGCHGREHERHNARLQAFGYPIEQMEERLEWVLTQVTRHTPKRWHLGVTCAVEHFTALLGDLILTHPLAFEDADPVMTRMWRWHALEENEHKGVAFDVYLAAGGTWPERSLVMALTTILFWSMVLKQQTQMMKTDGTLYSAAEWRELLTFLFLRDGAAMLKLLPKYLAYYRPSFHPWDFDNRALLEDLRKEYAAGIAA